MRLCNRRLALCTAAIFATRAPPAAVAKDRIDGYAVQNIDGREWVDVLSSGQYFILRQGGTEPPNSSPLVGEKRRGVLRRVAVFEGKRHLLGRIGRYG